MEKIINQARNNYLDLVARGISPEKALDVVLYHIVDEFEKRYPNVKVK